MHNGDPSNKDNNLTLCGDINWDNGFFLKSYPELFICKKDKNGIYDYGEHFYDNNNNEEFDEAPDNYNIITNIWEWSDGNENNLEITHIRGEPSIDRINYIMIGVQNTDTLNTI